MKRLILAMLLLAAPVAWAADDIYRPIENQNTSVLDYGSSSLSMTSAIGAQTSVVRVMCTTACWIAFSSGGGGIGGVIKAEAATSYFLPANIPELIRVSRGATPFAIQSSSGGDFHLQEMSK